MYIEFVLPTGAGGLAAQMASQRIRQSVHDWAAQHEIEYQTKVVKYTIRIVFDQDQTCEFFALSYDGVRPYRIVDPLNNLT